MPNRPAMRPIATCTVIGMFSSRASAHSDFTTSSWQNPVPRVASAIVSSWSSEEKWASRMRRTSSPGMAMELSNQYAASEVLALP
jgi:hypothetical protein